MGESEQQQMHPSDMRILPMAGPCDASSAGPAPWLRQYLADRQSAGPDVQRVHVLDMLRGLGADHHDLTDRSRGALLGLAIGDALGMALEFAPRDHKTLTGLEAGGPFDLPLGYWTDDTSMACCLAYSLIRQGGFDPIHQMQSYNHWYRHGAYSSTGKCFDIGITVAIALDQFVVDGEPYAGSTDPRTAGSGSLMRLAPIPVCFSRSFSETIHYAALSSRTTHQAVEAVDACRYYAGLMHGALHGATKEQLLDGLYSPEPGYWQAHPLCPAIEALARGSYKNKTRDEIASTGYVIHCMESALWAFHRTNDFESGALDAVNLAGDSDTVGAIYGQLAGAFYGEAQLPIQWIQNIRSVQGFYHFAEDLLGVLS
jgi:ADP-ribosylglycohydrolase